MTTGRKAALYSKGTAVLEFNEEPTQTLYLEFRELKILL